MFYFAYGMTLDPDEMRRLCPGSTAIGLAALHERRLAFPQYSTRWGGGLAGLGHAHGGIVWGALHEVTEQDLAAMDQAEGWRGPEDQHNLSDRELVTVELIRPDDGSVPRRVRAWTHVPRTSNPSPPSRRYLEALLKGARHHRLPDEYVVKLGAIEVGSSEP
jgi:hypothetical protein